jgi:transcriptional antiterminator RfaH
MEHWHLLHTKLRRERQVAVLLHQRGLEVYLPLVWRNPANTRSAREQPYFPSYLFVRMDLQRVEPDIIHWSPGLKGLVEFAHEPAIVSNSFISELQKRLSGIYIVDTTVFKDAGRAELAQIVEGPFAGYEGIFSSSLSATERAHILLACIERAHYRLAIESARRAALLDS